MLRCNEKVISMTYSIDFLKKCAEHIRKERKLVLNQYQNVL
ncbi:hypothetical protein OTSGILL_2633 [Orientia tsutsugamushi str. Gilliam]|uniref:Uncharacterized protein n=1 Tax=Orientia tsutsugamushi str. Gilliam TaxID=1359184 RepID=A0A0F3M5F7_ORITS|nr:hypothetical protein OTSGILL_2633 [Orientia tsutsugamushi str. Gilliam]